MKKIPSLWGIGVAGILLLTIAVRTYKLTAPVADWHSFRQSDTASVAREYVKNGIDILRPRYHDLSNIQSGSDNPEGWRMVEFPLYQAIAASAAVRVPIVPLDMWLRILSILASALTAAFLMLLVRDTVSKRVALLAGGVYAILPYSVFFGRTILPETFAVALAVASLYFIHVSRPDGRGAGTWLFLSGCILGALTILVKPTAGFLLLPIPYLIVRNYGFGMDSITRLAVYGLTALVPFWWWRGWIRQYPEGIAVFEWLFNKGDIRFKGAWFQWLFAERLGKLMLGVWGIIPFSLGLIVRTERKEGYVFRLIALGSLLYLVILAAGNVQHDYYQIILLPALAVYVAKGLEFLITDRRFSIVSRYSLLITSCLFMLAFSWYTVRTYYWINRPEIVEAGRVADRMLPTDAKVIAPYNGDTTFLYQTGRTGWPLGFDIDNKIAQGATHYVTVSPTDADFETMELANKYTVLVRNDRFAIIDLTKPGK